jgi:hypothetical protein
MRLVLAVMCAAVLLAASGATASSEPSLQLTSASPVTVTGSGFASREHVRVTFTAEGRVTLRKAISGPGGRFRAVFAGRMVPTCRRWVVRAVGSRGSRTALARPPSLDCPPPPPVG